MSYQAPGAPNARMIRKKDLLPLVCFSKTKLHSVLNENSPYHLPDFPKPIYLPKSRIPLWREAEVLAWLDRCERDSRGGETSKPRGLSVGNPQMPHPGVPHTRKPSIPTDIGEVPW